ncbi:MAG: hypothetical protein V1847_01215 [Candidatus Diapherotrites archaeon]
MPKHPLKRIRKSKILKEEIIADFIFLAVPFIITVAALFVFDIHWNFYPGGQLFPPAKFVFADPGIYVWGGLLGAIAGFFLIKLFLMGVQEEERVWGRNK